MLASLENMVVVNMIEKVLKIEIHAANPVDLERMEQAVKSIRKLDRVKLGV